MTSPHETVIALKPGQEAPEFALPSYPKGTIRLSDYRDRKNVVLAFYPKDDTPGCTKEMCSFSDDLARFEAAETEVFGISCDNAGDHQRFASKYILRQKLLIDKEGTVGQLYGAVRDGRPMAHRILFVIDKKGIIRHIHEGMPDNSQLLEVIKGF